MLARSRNAVWVNFVLASVVVVLLLGTAQIFLSPPDEDPASGWVHGLHGLFALFVLVTAVLIAHRDMRLLGLSWRGGSELPSRPTPPV